MPCFHPLSAWRARFVNSSGKRPLVFKRQDGLPGSYLEVSCGQCIGCRLEYSRQWAVRCYHESQLHLDNCMVTLTYDDDHLPHGGSLVPDHFSKFIKRLRRRTGIKLKHFSCGEYGDETNRPHYHACIFGYGFPDRTHWRTTGTHRHYRSDQLESLWKFGNAELTDFSFKTAAYVARYMVKKRKGRDAATHYERVDMVTGEIIEVLPEFSRMSLNPAVGKDWWEKYGKSVRDWDSVVIVGKELPPPKYYDVLDGELDAEELEARKLSRVRKAKASPDNTPERLAVREEIQTLRLKELRRPL